MENKLIEILKKQVVLLDSIQTVSDLDDWKAKTRVFICRIYKENSIQYKNFNKISAYPSITTLDTKPDVPKAVEKAKNLLNGFIEDIETFGLPTDSTIQNNKEKTPVATNINIENKPVFTQSQTQTQTMDIKDIIKDELPPAKMREIEEILKTEEPKETKLQKICDVLQKVGIGVVSSTLSKIITSSMGIF